MVLVVNFGDVALCRGSHVCAACSLLHLVFMGRPARETSLPLSRDVRFYMTHHCWGFKSTVTVARGQEEY